MNLANLGKAGLLTAQNQLLTTGHNINNAATDGYNRQSVLTSTAGATATAGGWIGRGVDVVSVQRSYNAFLSNQLNTSLTKQSALDAYQNQISQLNNLVADRTVGISPAIQEFFDAIQAVATNPADIAARQELLGRSESLATQLRETNAFLDNARKDINNQIDTTVDQINSQLERINNLNKQIRSATASNPGQAPNDLLDQRDTLVTQLGEMLNIKTFEQDGSISITTGNGQVLLAGEDVFELKATPSMSDPTQTTISYTVPDGNGGFNAVEMDESLITGGSLGGLLSYRREALDEVQNDLGRIALGLTMAINEQHVQGTDLTQEDGKEFFSISKNFAIPKEGTNAAALEVEYADYSMVTNKDYEIKFDGNDYIVTTKPGGAQVDTGNDPDFLEFDGLRIEKPASAQTNDSWLVQPTRNVAGSINLKITDPAKVAAASNGLGSANGDNALELANIQTNKIIGSKSMSLTGAYSQLVNAVAIKTQANETSLKAQDALVQQNFAAQQNVSGVNLDEEFIKLQEYQEYYRASAKLIDTSSAMFDTLLSLRS